MKPVLSPEAQLLLLVTRVPSGDSDRAIAALITQPMNWSLVGELAEREKLLPVLWNRLCGHAASIPPQSVERLRRRAVVTEFRMAMAEGLLLDVVDRLSQEGIRVMLLKGAALATTVYGSFAARPMGDLDILVPQDDAQRAYQCLAAAGWTRELDGGEEFYRELHHLAGLVDPRGIGIVIEIHRTILPTTGPFLLDEQELWQDARLVRLGQSEAWVLSTEHQLLHLCLHFSWPHMLYSGMGRSIRDIAALLDREPVDWKRFQRLAERVKGKSCAYWTLALAARFAGAAIPKETLHALRPRAPAAFIHALERALVASALLGACPSIQTRQLLWSAAIRPGASGHGGARPWKVGEAFQLAFAIHTEMSVTDRARTHLRAWRHWVRFMGILSLPRPLT